MSLTEWLQQLEPPVGAALTPGPWLTIDQQRIDQFAKVTDDYQFIHIDPERAKATSLGGPIAHGFLSLSLLTHLSEGCVPRPENLLMGINYGFDKVRFLNPVRPGDRIRFCARIMNRLPKGEHGYLEKLAISIEIEGQEKPALVCEWINLLKIAE